MRLLNRKPQWGIRDGPASSLTVSCTMGFASLWLVPRLMDFRAEHPGIDIRIAANNTILDIDRERIELAVRYCPADLAPASSQRLFGEEVFPVCAPGLKGIGGHPLRTPADLRHHVLLEQEHAETDRPSALVEHVARGHGAESHEAGGNTELQPLRPADPGCDRGAGRCAGDQSAGAPLHRPAAPGRALQAPHRVAARLPPHYGRRAVGRADVAAFSDWLLRNASQEKD